MLAEKELLHRMEQNNGIIRSRELERYGLRREVLGSLEKKGKIIRQARGIYCLADVWEDDFAVLQRRYPQAMFSYLSALYFHGLTDAVPQNTYVSVPQGYNATGLKTAYPEVIVSYIKKDLYTIGLTQIKTSMGGNVFCYDKERCICDIIKNSGKVEKQFYIQAIQDYFKDKTRDIPKLLKHASMMHIEDKVRTYTEIME